MLKICKAVLYFFIFISHFSLAHLVCFRGFKSYLLFLFFHLFSLYLGDLGLPSGFHCS